MLLASGQALAAPQASPRLTCSCTADANGSSDYCYGYGLSLAGRRMEFLAGETSASGRYTVARRGSSFLYSAGVRSMTGNRFRVLALFSRDLASVEVYTGALRRKNLQFRGTCRPDG